MKKAKNQFLRSLQRAIAEDVVNSDDSIYPLSRRKFIELSAKTGAGLAVMSSLPFWMTSCQSGSEPVVAIIGAGIGGLTAAHYLKKAHINATIYEAATRIGGRMYSAKDKVNPGITSEIGGEYIDSAHGDILDLIHEFGLPLKDAHNDPLSNCEIREMFYFHGKNYRMQEIIEEFRKSAPAIAHDQKGIGEHYDTILAKELDQLSISQYFDRVGINGWLRDIFDAAFTSECGLPISEQSALNFIALTSTDPGHCFEIFGTSDERFNILGGNDLLPTKMGESLKSQILMEYQLTKLKSTQNGYTLSFKNGKEVKADYVILAIPFTVLRQITLEADEISAPRLKAIHEMGYGSNAKLIMGFKERTWRINAKVSGYLFNETIQNGWDSSIMQQKNEGPGGYTVFLGGAQGKELSASTGHSETVLDKYLQQMDRIFPGSKNNYNGKFLIANWPDVPLARGSYSSFKVGQYTTMNGIFKEPSRNIYFVGEQCSPEFQGFMNGSVKTGKDAAVDLVGKLVHSSLKKK